MSITIDLTAPGRRVEAVLLTNVTALALQRLLPLELDFVRAEGALCATIRRPIGLWLEREERPPLRRGALVFRPETEELCLLLADLTPEQAAQVNPVGQVRGDVAVIADLETLRIRLEASPGPGAPPLP